MLRRMPMTYKDIIEEFRKSSLGNPDVKTFVYGDIYYLSKEHNIEYPVVILTPGNHTFVNNNVNNYSFTLVYVERLIDSRYKVDIHSRAISILQDISNRFNHYSIEYYNGDYSRTLGSVNVYTEDNNTRFADELSGAYIDITVELFNDINSCYYGNDCRDSDA